MNLSLHFLVVKLTSLKILKGVALLQSDSNTLNSFGEIALVLETRKFSKNVLLRTVFATQQFRVL